MAIAFCQGRGREPFATLVANCPGREVHPRKNSQVECGPIVPSRAIRRDGPRVLYRAATS